MYQFLISPQYRDVSRSLRDHAPPSPRLSTLMPEPPRGVLLGSYCYQQPLLLALHSQRAVEGIYLGRCTAAHIARPTRFRIYGCRVYRI